MGAGDGLANQTLEQLSIFQNKEMAHFRNVNVPEQIPHDIQSVQDRRLIKQLELTAENLNNKLSKLKAEMLKLKEENISIKASNDNHIYINEKLNKTLTKLMDQKKKGKTSIQNINSSNLVKDQHQVLEFDEPPLTDREMISIKQLDH